MKLSGRIKSCGTISGIALFILLFSISGAFAVPATLNVRTTDVTPASFSVVWTTDVPADPFVEVYSDALMTNRITDSLIITPMPAASSTVAQAAKSMGIMKVRVSGLAASAKYYFRAVTKDSQNLASTGYSPVYEVTTASKITPYRDERVFSNDLALFSVHVRPSDAGEQSGAGYLVIVETEGARYPVSAFAGDGIDAPWSIIDLNNLFNADGENLDLAGNEKMIITVYRKGTLPPLTHYRKVAPDGNLAGVAASVKGFFADINLDGKIDETDLNELKKQYRMMPDDPAFNPDFNFVNDSEDQVDVREFSKFSLEYGRTDVE